MTSMQVRLDQLGTWVTPSRGLKSWSGTPFFTLFPHFTHEDETLVRSSLLHFFVCPQNTLDPHAFGARGRHVSFWYKGSRQKFVLSPLEDQSWVVLTDPKSRKSLGRDQRGAAKRTRFCGFCAPFPCEFGVEIGTSNDLLPLEIGPTWYFGPPLLPHQRLSRKSSTSWVSKPTPKVKNHSGGTHEGPRKEPDSAAFVPRFRVNSA